KIYTEKSLMPYSFDLGIDTINNNSYKSTEKINDSFDLGINAINNNSYKSTEKIPYSFDLGIDTINNNSYKSTEKIPYSFDLGINTVNNNSYKSTEKIPYSFDLMGVGNNSTITTPNLKEISSSLGGPIHNLITAITIFKNNPQMNVAKLAQEITKRFLEDGYDDLEESLKPWILD
ncbi:11216_t:CDS:2, partial [Entrophospora sp. SA101]